MKAMVISAERDIYRAKPVRVLDFAQIPEAHRFMESNEANGKIVVRVRPHNFGRTQELFPKPKYSNR